jgi:ESS family glutamate:Na+ symporter
VIDPDFETPVATDYMYSAALVFVIVVPMFLMINMPAIGYVRGEPIWYWISLAICVGYMIFTVIGYQVLARRRAYARPSQLWLAADSRGPGRTGREG